MALRRRGLAATLTCVCGGDGWWHVRIVFLGHGVAPRQSPPLAGTRAAWGRSGYPGYPGGNGARARESAIGRRRKAARGSDARSAVGARALGGCRWAPPSLRPTAGAPPWRVSAGPDPDGTRDRDCRRARRRRHGGAQPRERGTALDDAASRRVGTDRCLRPGHRSQSQTGHSVPPRAPAVGRRAHRIRRYPYHCARAHAGRHRRHAGQSGHRAGDVRARAGRPDRCRRAERSRSATHAAPVWPCSGR